MDEKRINPGKVTVLDAGNIAGAVAAVALAQMAGAPLVASAPEPGEISASTPLPEGASERPKRVIPPPPMNRQRRRRLTREAAKAERLKITEARQAEQRQRANHH